jgi:hypothetical protein
MACTWLSAKMRGTGRILGRIFLKPEVGAKLMRDPHILRGPDGLFHMVWTSGWGDKGIGYANSPDLINWSEQRFLPLMEKTPGTKTCWAPEVYYEESLGQYLIVWSSNVEAPGVTPPKGGFHRAYYVLTKDFQTFTEPKMFFDPGFNNIDTTMLKVNGKYHIVFKETDDQPAGIWGVVHGATADHPLGPYTLLPEPHHQERTRAAAAGVARRECRSAHRGLSATRFTSIRPPTAPTAGARLRSGLVLARSGELEERRRHPRPAAGPRVGGHPRLGAGHRHEERQGTITITARTEHRRGSGGPPAGTVQGSAGQTARGAKDFPKMQAIDPMVFVDDDGSAYLYWGQGRCKAVKLNDDMISFNGWPTCSTSRRPVTTRDRSSTNERQPIISPGPSSTRAIRAIRWPTRPATRRSDRSPSAGQSDPPPARVGEGRRSSFDRPDSRARRMGHRLSSVPHSRRQRLQPRNLSLAPAPRRRMAACLSPLRHAADGRILPVDRGQVAVPVLVQDHVRQHLELERVL